MRTRTAVALVVVTLLLAGAIIVALGTGGGVTLVERWVSDTPRDSEFNHHPIGVGPNSDLVAAPVTTVPAGANASMADDACVLGSLAPANGSVLWRHGVDPDRCYSHAVTEPAVDDVDGDGRPEVAVATTEDALIVLDGTTGREAFRVSQPVYGYSPPAVADVLPAAGRELVTSDIGGNLVVARANGSVAWRRSLNETFGSATVWDAPVVADVDGDDRREIAVAANAGLAILSTNGTVEWADDTGATYVVDAQVDADPARELIVADGTTVGAVDGTSHDRIWSHDFGTTPKLETAGDVDGDGAVELLVGLPNGTAVSLTAATGEVEWTTQISTADDAVLAAPVVASTDGGNGTAVVAAARDGTVSLLDPATGAERAAYGRDVPVWTYPTPADLDGDGTDEILVRYGDGRVVALDPVA